MTMNQRHTLRASKAHADVRTNRRRTRGDDERAEIAEHLDDQPLGHVWQRSRLAGTMTCARCHLLPLDDEDVRSPCPSDEPEEQDEDDVPMCACGRDFVGNLGTHCLQCELEPYGIAWQLEQDGRL